MPLFTDQCGRSVSIDHAPQRIVSVVPSQTELLFDLGLNERVVGITKFCVHPAEWFRTKIRVGGTKTISSEIVHQLQPDLIIANKEENEKEQVEELATRYPVWVSDVNNLDDALGMIVAIADITSTNDMAKDIIQAIRIGFDTLTNEPVLLQQSACYLIWKEPFITIGGDTFINNMLQYCGLKNAFGHLYRYPEISITQIQDTTPQLLLLSSEPYPFREKHISEFQQLLPNAKIVLADGEMFSWYGSRLLIAPGYFANLRQRIADL